MSKITEFYKEAKGLELTKEQKKENRFTYYDMIGFADAYYSKQLTLTDVVLSNRYKTEEFSIYTPKDDECVVVIEDSFKHKRTFDVDDFNKLMSVLHSVQDY